MAKLIGKRYALALFEAGKELNKLDDFKEELNYISITLEKEPDLMKVLEHPKIAKKAKKDLITQVFKGKVSQEIQNFLYVIIDKGREENILDINSEYKKLYNEEKNIVEVLAVTAVPMDKGSQNRLAKILSTKMSKIVKVSNKVDKGVIGGVLLRIENKLIDGTIKGRLESMEKTIKGVKV